jgi:hypothetical protein
MLLLWSVVLFGTLVIAEKQAGDDPGEVTYLESVDAEPKTTILFPWFTEAVGVVLFFVRMKCGYTPCIVVETILTCRVCRSPTHLDSS